MCWYGKWSGSVPVMRVYLKYTILEFLEWLWSEEVLSSGHVKGFVRANRNKRGQRISMHKTENGKTLEWNLWVITVAIYKDLMKCVLLIPLWGNSCMDVAYVWVYKVKVKPAYDYLWLETSPVYADRFAVARNWCHDSSVTWMHFEWLFSVCHKCHLTFLSKIKEIYL